MAKIGIYGGAFNPPHKGHHLLAKQAVTKFELDRLIVIPSFVSPHKETDTNTSARDRYEMCVRAFADVDKCEVSDIEIKRGGVSYTSDTLRELKKEHMQDELILLMGDDMFLTFDEWHEPEIVAALATVAVFLRDRSKGNAVLDKAIAIKMKYNAKIAFAKNLVYEAASTNIRDDFAKTSERLQNSVAMYIADKGLYGNPYTALYAKVTDYIEKNISEKRKKHIYGTVESAVKLAERYNANILKAKLAALLHDVTKELPEEKQLEIIDKYHAETYDNEIETYKLMHQVTGAVYAKEVFGVDDAEVIGAVRYHTTGRPEMTLLEKIIYIADFIEPTRDYDGVEEIRKHAFDDLDSTCIVGLDFTIKSLTKDGKRINRHTLDAYRYYVDGSII